jgi:hypothetical protein
MKKKPSKPRREVVFDVKEEKQSKLSKEYTDNDNCTVIDFRGVPETGKAIEFVHAGGKVRATVLKINPNGTFYAVGNDSRNTKYPNVHTGDILEDGEDAVSHISKRVARNINNAANGRVTGKETKRVRNSSPSVPGQWKEPAKGSVIYQIIELHKQGLSKPDIIAKGFNKSTVARQVGEYIKAHLK